MDPMQSSDQPKLLIEWMRTRGVGVDQLASRAGIDRRVVQSIVSQRYTSSPDQRNRLAAALGVAVNRIIWGQAVPVDHLYGHGPQFGRSP